MELILVFLKAYWREILIVGLIVGAVGYVYHLNSTIDSLKGQNTTLTTANQIYKQDNEKLRASIDTTNTAITKLAQGAADTKNQFAALSGTVTAQSSALTVRLAQLLKGEKPKTCDDTMLYMLNAVKNYK